MSKFQVGDKVIFKGRHLEVVGLLDNGGIWIGSCGKGWIEAQEGDLEHADPQVPDVDGNPIRVGQLVEHSRFGTLDWVEAVFPESRTIARRFSETVMAGEHWRVVTDTFRPPKPDTRDVTLRVTVHDVAPHERDSAVADDLQRALDDDWPGWVTVEVVDDGGHDDSDKQQNDQPQKKWPDKAPEQPAGDKITHTTARGIRRPDAAPDPQR